ncbi:hypothetical protein [Catenovulum maritimum]|uniref:Uncharacterized protein n=1 Tax=Catenovulum maritimum TaxID=1513271 RepID=A0A0J8GSD9_9ALTE|nr:hypothetical protein [Catenovulum maritimum]KMT65642.1 hypothetical protein XM47_08070 [Catenovulum maritimum]
MNLQKLKQAESYFLSQYPQGFASEEMKAIAKRHNISKLAEFSQTELAPDNFSQPERILDALIKIISRSSMVSLFEKPKFKDFIADLNTAEKIAFSDAYYQRLYGDEQLGFEQILDLLKQHKMAKWSIISVVPFYLKPNDEVFVKPTTAKGIIKHFELSDMIYKPTPSWAFYLQYQKLVAEVKANIDDRIKENNAAITGFLMMSI